MSGYVYLIRVGDLYRIGKTDNLEKKIKKLKPDELLTSIMTKEPETLEARLLRKYKSQRIPETGYLKLSKRQIRECKKQFELKGSLPHTLDAEVSITLFASFLLFLLGSFILNYSNTKTVPFLIKKNSEVIEERLEIILWALSESNK